MGGEEPYLVQEDLFVDHTRWRRRRRSNMIWWKRWRYWSTMMWRRGRRNRRSRWKISLFLEVVDVNASPTKTTPSSFIYNSIHLFVTLLLPIMNKLQFLLRKFLANNNVCNIWVWQHSKGVSSVVILEPESNF